MLKVSQFHDNCNQTWEQCRETEVSARAMKPYVFNLGASTAEVPVGQSPNRNR